MPLDPKTNLEEKTTPIVPTRLSRAALAKKDESGLLNPSDRTYVGADIPGYDAPSTYEPYLNLDSYNIFTQDINKLRAENQGNFRQFLYGTAGGVSKGALHAIGGAAYLLDFDHHIKAAQGITDTEENWLSELTGKAAEGIGEATPIYQEDPSKVFDFSDGASYWKAWEGLVDSAVQFAAPGGAISKTASAVMRGGKLGKWIAQLATKSPTLAKLVEGAPGAVLMNEFEGNIMAYDIAKEVKGQLIEARDKGELQITDEEIEQKAADAFNDTKLWNKVFIPLQGMQLLGLAKGEGLTRNLLKDRSSITNRLKNFGQSVVAPNADNLILQGLGEAGEEITQGIMSSEAKYRSLKGTGLEEGSDDFLSRIKEYATADQTLLEGAMGFFGGGVQRVMMEGITGQYSKSFREEYNKRYNEQQAFMEKLKDYTQGKVNIASEILKYKADLIQQGRKEEADILEGITFDNMVKEGFQLGTMEMIENQLNDIISGKATPEQNDILGEDAKTKAAELLKRAKELEQLYLKYVDHKSGNELFSNRVDHKRTRETIGKINTSLMGLESEITADMDNRLVPLIRSVKGKQDFTYNRDEVLSAAESDIKQFFETGKAVTRPTSKDDFNKLVEGVKNTEEFKRYVSLKEIKDDSNKRMEELDKEFNNFYTGKYAGERARLKDTAAKKVNAINELYNSNQKEQVDNIPGVGSTILNQFGKPVKIIGFDGQAGVVQMQDLDGTKYTIKAENFDKLFRNPTTGKITKFIDKQVVNERQVADKNKIQAAMAPKDSSVGKAQQAVSKPATAPTKDGELDSIKVSNPRTESKTVTTAEANVGQENDNGSSIANALTWASYNNLGLKNKPESKEAIDIAEYLENPNNVLVGTTVKIEREPDNEFSKNAIKVTLLDKDGNPITNDGTEIVLYVRENKLTPDQKLFRDNLEKLLNESPVLYSKIETKYPGYIQFEKDAPAKNLGDVLDIKPEDMEFRVQALTRFVTGKKVGDNYEEDMDLLTFGLNPKEEGQVVIKVKTANGVFFPLNLTVKTLTDAQAEAVFQIYTELLDKATVNSPITNYSKILDAVNKSGIKEFLPKDALIKDALHLLTDQGDSEASFPLYIDNHVLYFGRDENVGSIPLEVLSDPIAAANAKVQFKEWLTKYKIQSVYWKQLSNPAYRKYLVENTLESKARFSNGRAIFAQPLITIDNNVTAELDAVEGAKAIKATPPTSVGVASLLDFTYTEDLLEDTTPVIVPQVVQKDTNDYLEAEVDQALGELVSREQEDYVALREQVVSILSSDIIEMAGLKVITDPAERTVAIQIAVENIYTQIKNKC